MIICSAIKFQLIDSEYFHIMCGKRHADILQTMFSLGIKYNRTTHIQGFLTDENQFVDRYDAFDIALESEQILPEVLEEYQEKYSSLRGIALFSEDIWPD